VKNEHVCHSTHSTEMLLLVRLTYKPTFIDYCRIPLTNATI